MEQFLAQYGVWIGLVLLIWEYILGKTDLIKPASTIELIGSIIMKVFKALIGSK